MNNLITHSDVHTEITILPLPTASQLPEAVQERPESLDSGHLGNFRKKPESSDSGHLGNFRKKPESSDSGHLGNLRMKPESSDSGHLGNIGKKPESLDSGHLGNNGKKPESSDSGHLGNIGKKPESSDSGLFGKIGKKPESLDSGHLGNNGKKPESSDSGHLGNIGKKPESSDSGLFGNIGKKPESADSGLFGNIGKEPVSPDCGSGILSIEMTDSETSCTEEISTLTCSKKISQNIPNIRAGMEFHSHKELMSEVKEYEKVTHSHLTLRDSKKLETAGVDKVLFPKRLVHFVCVYHRDPKKIRETSKSKGMRPKQSYFASNCPFQLVFSFYKNKGCYVVSKFNEVHVGHEVSQHNYESHPHFRRVSAGDLEKYGKFAKNLKVPNHILREEIFKDTGKMLKNQDIVNLKHKFFQDKGYSQVEKCLSLLKKHSAQDPNSNLQVVYEETMNSKVIKCLFWQSNYMKRLFQDFGSVIFMDGTYNLTNRGYTLVTVSVKDNHENGKMVAWALLSQETKSVMSTMLECLCEGNSDRIKDIKYVVIDKDFSEIAALHKILPHVHFVICRYHAIKAVTTYMSKVHLKSNEQKQRSVITDSFVGMVYSDNEYEYNKHWEVICSIQGSSALNSCKDYLDKFWHSIREHWAFYILKTMELFDSFTNNRSEALNKNIKQRVSKNSSFENVIEMLMSLSNNQEKSLRVQDFESSNKVYMPQDIGDVYHEEIVRIGNSLVTREVLKCLENQYEKSKMVDVNELTTERGQTKCPRLAGSCKYSDTNSRPCAHLLAIRKFNKEVMLTPEMFAKHWFQKSARTFDSSEKCNESKKIFKKMSGKKEKFTTVKKVCKDIATSISDMEKSKSEYNLQVLSQVEKAIKQGVQISFDGTNIDLLEKPKVSSEEFEFDNSQSPSFKHERQSSFKKAKVDRGVSNKPKKSSLLPWQSIINRNVRLINQTVDQWDAAHFDEFSGTGWLGDTHMGYFCALMNKQFPAIKCFEPFDYQILAGFPSVDGKDFIQIVHSGTDHWAVLTNLGIPQEKKNKEVILYDSLVQLKGKKSCLVKSAVEWQACQLLRDGSDPHPKSLIIHTYPCQQQTNGYDCGVFALAFAISLAYGQKPEETQYVGNLRKELMEMLLNGVLEPLRCVSNKVFLRSAVLANMHVNVRLTKMHKSIDALCYCRLPESYGDLIQCQECKLYFHQRCFLIGSSHIAEKITKFICFGCRKICDYSFVAGISNVPESTACTRVAQAILSLQSNQCSTLSCMKSIQAEKMFSTFAQYCHFEQFVVKYDLNRVCTRTGDIYNAMYNFYSNADSHIVQKYPFHTLSLAEIFRLAVLLICSIEKVSLPPFVQKHGYSTLGEAISKNKKWISTLLSTGDALKKSMKKLLESGKSYVNAQDRVSTIMSEVTSLSVYADEVKNALQKDYEDCTDAGLLRKNHLLEQIQTVQESIQSIYKDMERYKSM